MLRVRPSTRHHSIHHLAISRVSDTSTVSLRNRLKLGLRAHFQAQSAQSGVFEGKGAPGGRASSPFPTPSPPRNSRACFRWFVHHCVLFVCEQQRAMSSGLVNMRCTGWRSLPSRGRCSRVATDGRTPGGTHPVADRRPLPELDAGLPLVPLRVVNHPFC